MPYGVDDFHRLYWNDYEVKQEESSIQTDIKNIKKRALNKALIVGLLLILVFSSFFVIFSRFYDSLIASLLLALVEYCYA